MSKKNELNSLQIKELLRYFIKNKGSKQQAKSRNTGKKNKIVRNIHAYSSKMKPPLLAKKQAQGLQ